jgi:hypothetical protein
VRTPLARMLPRVIDAGDPGLMSALVRMSAKCRFCCKSRRPPPSAQLSNPTGAPLESMLRVGMQKIFLQQYLPIADKAAHYRSVRMNAQVIFSK